MDSTRRAACLRSRFVYDRLISVAGLTGETAGGGVAPDYTLIESVRDGWFYSALLPNVRYIATFTTDADLYAAGRARSSTYLNEQLRAAPLTMARIGRFFAATAAFSAITTQRKAVVQSNWMAVGDAARSYDPLSGHGSPEFHAVRRAPRRQSWKRWLVTPQGDGRIRSRPPRALFGKMLTSRRTPATTRSSSAGPTLHFGLAVIKAWRREACR